MKFKKKKKKIAPHDLGEVKKKIQSFKVQSVLCHCAFHLKLNEMCLSNVTFLKIPFI